MTDSLEEKIKTETVALRERSINGENMSTEGSSQLDQAKIEELRHQYEEPEGDYSNPPETYTSSIKKNWPEEAASERAAYITMANGGDHAFYLKVKEELMNQGESAEDDATQAEINRQDIESRIEAAGSVMHDLNLSLDEKKAYINSLKEDITAVKNVDVADELTLRLMEQNPFDLDKKHDALVERLESRRKIEGVVAEVRNSGYRMSVGGALDLLGSFVSANDMTSYHKLLDHLGIEFSNVTHLAPGELLTKVRDFASTLGHDEKYQLALNLQEFLLSEDGAGIVDSNAIQAANMMVDVFDLVEADPDAFDWNRWLMNAGPTIDAWSIGVFSFIKNAVTSPFRYAKLSRLNRANAADPDTAADIAARAALDPNRAEMLGETSEGIIVKSTTPKPEGVDAPMVPGKMTDEVIEATDEQIVTEYIDETRQLVLNARGKNSGVAAKTEVEEITSNNKLWLASSEISGEIGKPWKVKAVVGKNGQTGFSNRDEAVDVLNNLYDGKGQIISRTNTIDGVEEVVEKGQEFPAALTQVRRELESIKVTKMSRGDEKKLRGELRQLQIEKARRQEATQQPVTLGGTKAQRKKAVARNQVIQREIEPLQREINEIQGLLDANAISAKAEADLSRLLNVKTQKQLDESKVEKATRNRINELMKDNIIQTAKPKQEAVEYFVQVERKGELRFANDDVQVSLFNERGSWAFDADTLLAKTITQVANMMFDRWKGVEKEMLRFLDPIAELPRKDQILISKILAKGNEKGKNYSHADIRRMVKEEYKNLKPETINRKLPGIQNAYTQFRKAMDIMFTIENRNFREMLDKKNMKHIQSGDYDTFAEPLSRDKALDVKQAFNPVTKEIEPVKAETLYGSGYQLGRLRKTEIIGDEGTNFILLKDTDINKLPQMVLKKRPGYLPQTNESNYFLTRSTTVKIDGVKQNRLSTVGVASSLKEANLAKKNGNLNRKGGEEYDWKHDRALTYDEFVDSSLDLYQHTGGLFYSKRGDRMSDTSNVASKIRDPLAAAVSGISRVSRDATMTQYIRDMKARFVDTYGDMLLKREFPTEAKDIKVPGKAWTPELAKARTMFRSIQMFDGYGQYSSFRKNAVILSDIAETYLGKPGEVLAKLIRSQADSDPVSFIRGKNFEFQIATNPIAQFVLQPTQALNMIALGANARDFQRGWSISKLARQRADVLLSDEDLAGTARSLGMSVSELRQDIQAFRRSGMGAAVTAHETARDAAPGLSRAIDQGAIGRVTSAATETLYTKPVGVLRRGFERGEEFNLGVHWLTAKKRWMKDNKGKSPYTPEAQAAIQGEARSLSLSMIRTGDFAYQRGILALPTQYLAVTHKQLLLMLPGGSKAVTTSEKAKIALLQLGLWGPTGLGLGALWEYIATENELNLSEGAMQVVTDGMTEAVINGGLNMIFDDETDLDIAGRYAPGGGINDNLFTVIMESFLNNEVQDVWKLIFGPTKSTFNRFYEAGKAARIVFNTDGIHLEGIQNAGEKFLSVLSSYNNINKNLVYGNIGYVTDKNGVKLYEPSTAELIGSAVLGIPSNKMNDYYATKRAKRKYDEWIDDMATEYHQHLVNIVGNAIDSYTGAEEYAAFQAYYHEQMILHNAVIQMHEQDAPVIMAAVARKVKNLARDGKNNLAIELHRLLMRSGEGSSADDVINRAISAGLIKAENVERIRESVRNFYGEDNANKQNIE